jgi:putative ABC transport system substrate-binding protein
MLPRQRSLAREGQMSICLQRREFIAGLGGAAASWPLAARAQQPGKLPTVGFLTATNRRPWTDAFVARLRELGWIEGRTIAIVYRWDEGRPERVTEIAAEFVRLKVDVIVTYGAAIATLKQATAVIPIVFAVATDPVGGGLVASLPRPGGNVTGLSAEQTDLAGKRVQLLREVVPGLRRLAVMVNVDYPSAVLEMGEVQAAARTLNMEVVPLEILRAGDIAPAFEVLKARADALYVAADTLVEANRRRIITLALGARLPTIFSYREFVQAGGLMSYGPKLADQFWRAAELVDKILHRTKPADIPVEQSSTVTPHFPGISRGSPGAPQFSPRPGGKPSGDPWGEGQISPSWAPVGLWKALPRGALPHCGQGGSAYDLGGEIDMGQRASRGAAGGGHTGFAVLFFASTGGPDEHLPSTARIHRWTRRGGLMAARGARAAGRPRAAHRRAHAGRRKRAHDED